MYQCGDIREVPAPHPQSCSAVKEINENPERGVGEWVLLVAPLAEL